jgi:CRISPR-associated protein Cmr2
MSTDHLWQTKLAARLHDPAEKALVLLRDPAGHEGGTSRALRRLLGLDALPAGNVDPDNDEALATLLFKQGLPADVYRLVQRADWWAAAADRPQWPMDELTVKTKTGDTRTLTVAHWAQVRWTQQPVLIHPLTGDSVDLHNLSDTELDALKRRSFDHFAELLVKLDAQGEVPQDWRKMLLAFWRFGPDLAATGADTDDNHKLGALWEVLPADTRVPDHSIWDHLDLTSAFAGAFAADPDGEAALLALSIGPVQGFIAAARSTSDLWAGSHLLSRLAWEAMRPVCEELGPDAILFPRLRGIPQVDLWLRDAMGLPEALFKQCEWNRGATDANPLFAAALPNRLVAVVPASRAREIAETVTRRVREWLARLGEDVVMRLLHEAGFDKETTLTPYEQMKAQLAGFPEVHWAAVPFALIRCRDPDKQRDLDTSQLSAAMAPFFYPSPASGRGDGGEGAPGFLATPAWQVLQKEIAWGDGTTFFAPNPGVLYPAVYDLAERVLAAAKSTRPFGQSAQQGWRCSLTGETEWLTTDRAQLGKSYRQQSDTLWARIAARKPSWAKKGEHLGALAAIKRLWPTIFAEEVGKALNPRDDGTARRIDRFVVSTHTMALASQLDRWLEHGGRTAAGFAQAADGAEPVALPRALMLRHAHNPALADAKRIPGLLEAANDDDDDDAGTKRARDLVRSTLATASGRDTVRLETYYALLMMDGDRMGAILAGDDQTAIGYRDSFHPHVRKGFDERAAKHPLIERYGKQRRAISPNRHLAVSGALNDFSQTVVRHVVESEYLGRVIYAGGDDVLAMLPVADLLPAMQRLRHAYSGTLPEDEHTDWGALRQDRKALHCKNGFAYLNGRLMRMMGRHATASTGAVIAHHQAPLGAVLRELRQAEKRAKSEGGRDAFSITVIKRSGGALHLTEKWGEPVTLLDDTIAFLADPVVSRRAVYNSVQWLTDLPDPKTQPQMLAALLGYQLARQAQDAIKAQAPDLARRLAALASRQPKNGLDWLRNFLSVAEFLARETRAGAAIRQLADQTQGATA